MLNSPNNVSPVLEIGPSRQLELQHLSRLKNSGVDKPVVVGIDEVGRGCLAGPVMVGICAVNGTESDVPAGLNDSKALSEKKREQLFEPLKEWCWDWEVGAASAAEIDEIGIVKALRLAANRALQQMQKRGVQVQQIILDGSHDWFTPPAADLFSSMTPTFPDDQDLAIPVEMLVKGDQKAVCIAAAAVIAKVTRDRFMLEIEDPGYDWATNKGYGTAKHVAALKKLGPCAWHRHSWRLPKVDSEAGSI